MAISVDEFIAFLIENGGVVLYNTDISHTIRMEVHRFYVPTGEKLVRHSRDWLDDGHPIFGKVISNLSPELSFEEFAALESAGHCVCKPNTPGVDDKLVPR